jgi:hypothetical protein
MKTIENTAVKESRCIQISLRIEDEAALKNLTKENNTMPSWVLGEEIAKKLDKGRRSIEINLSALFLAHQV